MDLINFYSFFPIKEPKKLGHEWYDDAQGLNLTGTILIAQEGINLALYGEKEKLSYFFNEKVGSLTELEPAVFRRKSPSVCPYRKLKLKIRNEIVTSGFSENFHANSEQEYISPESFHSLALSDSCIAIDMRNDYESQIGSFRNSLILPMNEFTELPNHLENLVKHRNKHILTFCTGGVRCEKTIPLLKKNGFRVSQLHGGILNYLEKYGERKDSLWEGECFVFDDRVSITSRFERGSYEWCPACGQPFRNGKCVVCKGS